PREDSPCAGFEAETHIRSCIPRRLDDGRRATQDIGTHSRPPTRNYRGKQIRWLGPPRKPGARCNAPDSPPLCWGLGTTVVKNAVLSKRVPTEGARCAKRHPTVPSMSAVIE